MRTRTTIHKNDTGTTATTEAAPPTAEAGQTPAVPSMDELAARVDAASKALEPTTKTFTPSEFAAYVNDQLELSKAEDAERAQARLKALQEAIGIAKLAFESSGSASIPMFNDPWQTKPQSKGVESPTGVSSGTSNIQYPEGVNTAKRAFAVTKAIAAALAQPEFAREYEAAVAASVQKADGTTVVQKAGEAAAMLDHIAAMFGVELEPGEYCELRWAVGDVISALVEANRIESAMTRVAALMSVGSAPAPAAEPAEPAEPGDMAMAEGAQKSVTKSDGPGFENMSFGAVTDADGWPVDMNAASRVSKSSKQEEEIRF